MRLLQIICLINIWLILTISGAYNHISQKHYFDCGSLPGLTRKQLEICKRNRHAMRSVASGLKEAMEECKSQFAKDKWNCSLNQGLGIIPLKTASKESAYIHALFSGAVGHSVAKACALGQIPDCQCGDQPRHAEKNFIWAGCSDNIKYGNWFSRRFVDATEKHKMDSRALMNLHNNRVGRKLLASNMKKQCKCHGVSGSCVTKTCWRSVPNLEDFASILKHKYEKAQQVAFIPDKEGLMLKPTTGRTERYISARLSPTPLPSFPNNLNLNQLPANKGELVFLEESPDYCVSDPKQEIHGTSGRECANEDQCHDLCCGRGWEVIHEWVEEPCHCKFIYCCEVKCETCTKLLQKRFCR